MGSGFSQKEMLIRVLNKLESMEITINHTHEQATNTNGAVKLHTKLIMALGGALIGIVGWIIKIAIS